MSFDSMNQEELKECVIDDGGDGCEVIEKKTVDSWRWGTIQQVILHELATDSYWSIRYALHTTEGMQDGTFKVRRVKPVEKTIVIYEDVL